MPPSAEPSDDIRGNFETVSSFHQFFRFHHVSFTVLSFFLEHTSHFPFQPPPEDPRAGCDQPPHAHEDGAAPRPRANHPAAQEAENVQEARVQLGLELEPWSLSQPQGRVRGSRARPRELSGREIGKRFATQGGRSKKAKVLPRVRLSQGVSLVLRRGRRQRFGGEGTRQLRGARGRERYAAQHGDGVV